MTFKVLQCNTDQLICNRLSHRGVFIAQGFELMVYNSALSLKSDHYLPVLQQDDKQSSKTAS